MIWASRSSQITTPTEYLTQFSEMKFSNRMNKKYKTRKKTSIMMKNMTMKRINLQRTQSRIIMRRRSNPPKTMVLKLI